MHYRKISLIWAVLFLLLGYGLFPYSPVRAQTIGVRISPTIFEDYVDPGQLLDLRIKVTNSSEIPKDLQVYLRDFKASDESGKPKLIAPGSEPGNYLTSWLEFPEQTFSFAAGEEKVVSFFVKVPANAGPGGYYGAVYFGAPAPTVKVESEDKGAAIATAQQTGALLLLTVRGDMDERANVREFTTDRELYSAPFDVKFLVRIEDMGNVHVKPIGEIAIKNLLGREAAKLDFNKKGNNVLPKQIRGFEETWSGNRAFGRYKAVLTLSYGTPASQGGEGKKTIYTEKTFWIIPWKIVVPLFLSIVFLIGALIVLFRYYRSRAVNRILKQMGVGQARGVLRQPGLSPTTHFGLILLVLLLAAGLIGFFVYFLFLA